VALLHTQPPERPSAHATRSVRASRPVRVAARAELRFEPELAELDRLLEDDQIFRQVKADLSRRRPHTTETGRPSTPVEVILRLLVVQHLYEWSYAQTEHFVGDCLVLRQFCRLGLDPVPHHTTLMRWANQMQPETMHRPLDRVTDLARSLR
jgi:transposase, IS5 family